MTQPRMVQHEGTVGRRTGRRWSQPRKGRYVNDGHGASHGLLSGVGFIPAVQINPMNTSPAGQCCSQKRREEASISCGCLLLLEPKSVRPTGPIKGTNNRRYMSVGYSYEPDRLS